MKIDRNKINMIMANKVMTVTSLSKKYGVTRGRMSTILGSAELSPSTVGKLAKSLDVEVLDIVLTE